MCVGGGREQGGDSLLQCGKFKESENEDAFALLKKNWNEWEERRPGVFTETTRRRKSVREFSRYNHRGRDGRKEGRRKEESKELLLSKETAYVGEEWSRWVGKVHVRKGVLREQKILFSLKVTGLQAGRNVICLDVNMEQDVAV